MNKKFILIPTSDLLRSRDHLDQQTTLRLQSALTLASSDCGYIFVIIAPAPHFVALPGRALAAMMVDWLGENKKDIPVEIFQSRVVNEQEETEAFGVYLKTRLVLGYFDPYVDEVYVVGSGWARWRGKLLVRLLLCNKERKCFSTYVVAKRPTLSQRFIIEPIKCLLTGVVPLRLWIKLASSSHNVVSNASQN